MGCTDCGKGCAKCLLILFNIIFFAVGAVLFAVGIWIRVDPDIWDYVEFADYDQNDRYLEFGAYLIIALGAFILLTSIFGFCGAIRENQCCLGIYIFIIFVCIAAQVAAAALFIIYRDDLEEKVKETLEEEFPTEALNEPGSYWNSLKAFQEEFECCGINGPGDYDSLMSNASHLIECTGSPNTNTYPQSCCDGTTLYTKDCWGELKDFIEGLSIIGIGLAIGFGCIEILGFIFALCLCMNAGSSGKYE